ncbi:AMP-binding protein [Nocardia sp. NPDC003979]
MNAAIISQSCPLPAVLDAMAENHSSAIICRPAGSAVTHRITHARCRAEAEALARALHARGVGPGSRVAIHGSTSYEWVLADLACLSIGAISVALYPSAPIPRVVSVAEQSRCTTVLTDVASAVAPLRESGCDVIFLGGATDSPVGTDSVSVLIERAELSAPIGAALSRQGPFTVVSTSGTLSEPKLFSVIAEPLLFTMDRFAELYDFGADDRLLLYLPLSHLPQRMMLYWGLRAGMDFILSSPVHMVADSAAFEPTLHVTVPRVLEHLRWRVGATIRGNDAISKTEAYRSMFGAGIRSVFVGSAPTDKTLMSELLDAGVPIYEVYGTTELGMVCLNTPQHRNPGTAGHPIPWGQVRIDPHNWEVQVRTPTPFLHGHLVDDRIEPYPWDSDRFTPTGDVGKFDAHGYLTVLGRLHDFIVLPSGEKVFAAPIETMLAEAISAGLCQILRTADGLLGALLFFDGSMPDHTTVSAALVEINRALHPWERVKVYATVAALPTVAEGCVTETGKPRRHAIEALHGSAARWHSLIPGQRGAITTNGSGQR